MRTVIFRLGGVGSTGDTLVFLGRPSNGGGQSIARYFCKGASSRAYLDGDGNAQKEIIEADNPERLAQGLAAAINTSNEFMSDHLTAKAVGDLLTLACSHIYAGVQFTIEAQGNGRTETAEELS